MKHVTTGDSGLPPDLTLAGTVVADDRLGWSRELCDEFEANAFNGRVGGCLRSETDHVRVWEIRLAPGERLPVHRHVLDYFWTAVTAGRSRQHTSDGTTRDVVYERGESRHFTFGSGEYLLHDLENTGATTLVFTTVEFKEGSNPPLPLQDQGADERS
ncbi:cupin domain-containing protein [Streptomyces jumonjinensis]|uniref:Cupin domain-containing protein n=1 Tax=Streptomyces jumonjinensis TaxID=1945 RepID=A0A646KQE8_STRJU|nr:hypothetical protein [Streptomyces jumonjinensis]MQT04277.1 hypothetical protein [Streptomyces jumonjinensis]